MARQPFNTRWAQGVEGQSNLNSFQAPSDVRVSTGWEGGQDKDAPPAGQENWWHNRVDSALQGVERNGVMSWHSQAVYGLGAPTYASDGNYYESLAANNTGNNPVLTTGFWRYAGSSFFAGSEPGDGKIVYHNNTPSTGWLKCNGAILLRASYPRLFAVIGTTNNIGGETSLQFRLPDFRGEFVRGFDDGRGVDSGRVFGSAQASQNLAHTHLAPTGVTSGPDGGSYEVPAGNGSGGGGYTAYDYANAAPTNESGGNESRPRNKVVNYWIRY